MSRAVFLRLKKRDKRIAMERIEILFKNADDSALNGNIENANRYIELARRIAMKYNIRIPREYKRKFCKYCYRYLLPGRTSRTRINSRMRRVEIKCLSCGRRIFYPLNTKNEN
ncbi:MAG: hypothetical protein DRO90_02750 [Candidatus Altiarchaeales archaeon]|nr:MAG: hypothetical protein DRO95_03625 [Candidatus Altiarchaeales archaeon]RLI93818.1 MAG: hypothetical protein DRO94_04345 [Candidatus Altiarchaeales archaeon]RLI93997.1 MAG: hypothetical protein DRO90_02750 [Candidatus Altiarchaeales archaeon]HDO82775.1 hypothetical protein [Candidatus Altiarchaeales archaeon]HEX55424.1 hypothetical protein [Candidatus Altiarchaeales archaeon]